VFSHAAGVAKILLACEMLPDLTTRDRFNHISFFENTLATFGKSLSNLKSLVGDNTALNPAIARELNIPFIGCYSHRLNLAMSAIFKYHSDIFDEIEEIMAKLRAGNNTGILHSVQRERNKKTLNPCQSTTGKPRWSAKFELVKKYLQLHDDLSDDRLIVAGVLRLDLQKKQKLQICLQ